MVKLICAQRLSLLGRRIFGSGERSRLRCRTWRPQVDELTWQTLGMLWLTRYATAYDASTGLFSIAST